MRVIAMNARVQTVCNAAFPNSEPPDDKILVRIDDELSWAATWFEVRSRVATRSMTEDTARKRQPDLAQLARKAAKLLGADAPATRELQYAVNEAFEVGHPPPLSKATTKILNSIKPHLGFAHQRYLAPRSIYFRLSRYL
jgi:hypothetical protein